MHVHVPSVWLPVYGTGAVACYLRRTRDAGGGGFSPTDIAGLVAWYKADAIGGLSDNDPVATWADSSGNGRDATQGTAANKPTYQTGEVNSLPCVRFDGSNDVLAATCPHQPDFTLFVVLKPTGGAIDNYQSAVSRGAVFENDTNFAFAVRRGGANEFLRWCCYWRNVSTLYGNEGGGWVDATWTYVAVKVDGSANLTIYEKGSSEVTDGSNSASTDGSQSLRIGGPNSTTSSDAYFTGDIAEVILYDSALSDGDRGSVESYLGTKYAL